MNYRLWLHWPIQIASLVMSGLHCTLHFNYPKRCNQPWNVLLSHLNGERTMSERWVNGERTLNERWANAEWTMSERWTQVGERYVNDERTRNANGAQTRAQCEWWTHDERFIRKVSGIFLALYSTSNLVGIYVYELLNFVILFKHIYFLFKRTAWNRNYLYMIRR